ncbi:MAG: Polysulfide reductase, NrfD [Acidobacteriales bacterium]|nr:Polysulfide reductase, NrfD [Terriglobales bacterium]
MREPLKREQVPDDAREARLVSIRKEAEKKGRLVEQGVRPVGAPFPKASPETGYYGIPLLKEPQWTWQVPIYFFVGGASGAAALIGALAKVIGKDERLARDARLVAAGGGIISSGLLIADLGRPERFLNMLRVFKIQSPMSVGAWVLAFFSSSSGAAAFAQLVEQKIDIGPIRVLGNVAEGFSAAMGLPLATYTGVLIGATAIPAWNHNIKSLPIHFGMSGLGSGVSVLELMGNDDSPALNMLGIGASAVESYEGFHLEFRRDPQVNRPLKHGLTGWTTRLGGLLSGPVPLALRLIASASGSRRLRRAAAWSSIAGSILTRVGWIYAGRESARDWRIPLQIEQPPSTPELASERDVPQMRAG